LNPNVNPTERPISCADAERLYAALGSLQNLTAESSDAAALNREELQPYVSALSDLRRASDAVLLQFAERLISLTRRLLAGKRAPVADARTIKDSIDEVCRSLEDAKGTQFSLALHPISLSPGEIEAIPAADLAVIRRFCGK
jgi:hypothetical protein